MSKISIIARIKWDNLLKCWGAEHQGIYSSYCPETKIQTYGTQITLSKIDEICLLAIPKPISTISVHIPSLVVVDWYLHKLSSGNKNMDAWQADNSVKNWQNLPISNPKLDLYNINAHSKFGENPLTFTQVIVWKWKYRQTDIWQTDGWMEGHTDAQGETIIPCHYGVARYKKKTKKKNIYILLQFFCWRLTCKNNKNKAIWRTAISPAVEWQWSGLKIQGSNWWPSIVTLTLSLHCWVMGSAHLTKANIWPKFNKYLSRVQKIWSEHEIQGSNLWL